MSFHQHVISSISHFINMSFHQYVISSTCNFIKMPFHQHVISSTCHFIDMSFHRHIISSTCHFIDMLFRWQVFFIDKCIWTSSHNFINSHSFSWSLIDRSIVIISSTCHFIKCSFCTHFLPALHDSRNRTFPNVKNPKWTLNLHKIRSK